MDMIRTTRERIAEAVENCAHELSRLCSRLVFLQAVYVSGPNPTYQGFPVKTMATNGIVLVINEDFAATLTDPELNFVVAHEACHCIFRHPQETADVLKQVVASGEPVGGHVYCWAVTQSNIAQDKVINWILCEATKGMKWIAPPKDGVFGDKDEDWLTLFDELMRQCPPPPPPPPPQPPGNPKPSDGDEGEDSGEGDGPSDEPGDESGEGGTPSDQPGEGGMNVDGGMGGVIPCSDEDRPTADENFSPEALIEAAMLAKACGSDPGDLRRAFDRAARVNVPWRMLLADWLQTAGRDDEWSFRRCHPMSKRAGWYMPTLGGDDLTEPILVVFDTSGSMGQREISDCYAATKNLIEGFENLDMLASTCDTRFYGPWTKDEIPDSWPGGGGTSFQPPLDWAADHGIEKVIYFTDGEGSYRDAHGLDVIWMLTSPNRTFHPANGRVVSMDDWRYFRRPRN